MSRIPEYGDEEYRGSEEVEGGLRFVSLNDVLEISAAKDQLEPDCESPIELQLGAQIKHSLPEGFQIQPQYVFGRYRMDFAIISPRGGACLFIECDGKAFHSTDEQQANDRAKDAAAARAHIPLLRFTGSRIFRDVKGCAQAVIKLIEGLA